MVAGPPPELLLVAPGAAAAFGTTTSVWLHTRHAKRHVRNLPHNFRSLEHQMDLLHGRWKDINNSIDLQLATRQRNTQHQNWDRVVSWTLEYYQELTGTYKKAVGVQSDQNPATENQTLAALEHESDANPETESDADPETGNQTPTVGVQSAGNPATENQTPAALERESDAKPAIGIQMPAVEVQSDRNPATENQTPAALEHESDANPDAGNQLPAVGVQSDRSSATENQTSADLEHESDANPETGNQTPVRDLLDASKGWPKKWYGPLFPKFYKLASLDKDVLRFTPLVTSLRNEMKEENMTSPRIQQIVVREDAKEVSHIPSHNRILGELRTLLQQNCKRIAIYGASQVGKTNILKNLNNGPLPLQFDRVIWVTFPTHLEKKEEIIKNIQDKILLRLNLADQSSTSRNADLISEALSAESYLLLFDGFSSSIVLSEIGIFGWHNRGKVIIETENPNRLQNVEFDGFIEVKCLLNEDKDEDSDSDSRILFVKIIKNEKFCNENRALVGSILRELGGHPGVIASMADWLKRDIRVAFWKAVMQKLQKDVGEPDLLGLGGQKNAFDITYKERLTEDRYRRCLLYAALFPKGFTIPINVLVECWKAEDFLSCPLATFIEARGDGEIILNKLTGLYLLEHCSDPEQYIKMPINFRRVARHTPFPGEGDEPSFVRSGPEIDGHLKDEEWGKARRVSLMQSKLRVLPFHPKCERMSTLFLQLNPELEIIRETFFRRMQNLRVLDLNSTGIKLLPPTISYLTALRSLYLNNCSDLTVLPPEIVGLKKLEVLDIRFTPIHCVPEVVSSLVGLRCFRFSFVPEACNPNPKPERTFLIFSPGTAVQLNDLEELTIVLVNGTSDDIYDQIEAEVPKFKNRNNQFELIPPRPSQSLVEWIRVPSLRSDNEDSSRGGRTGANSPARTKDKGKEQVDAIDRSKFSDGASTSGAADGAD